MANHLRRRASQLLLCSGIALLVAAGCKRGEPSPSSKPTAARELRKVSLATSTNLWCSLPLIAKAQGFFESSENFALTAHGGDLNGFILLHGERAKLDELRRTDAFERLVMRLGGLFSGLGVIPGLNGAGIQKVMERVKDALR